MGNEINKIWDTVNIGIDTKNTLRVITEQEVLDICKEDIEGKQNNRLGLEYKIIYMPVVVGVDRYDKIQDVSTVTIGKILNNEYIN